MTKRQPPNWIIGPRSSHGALDDTQVKSLADEFMLPEPEIRKLSKTLAHPLSERFAVRGIFKVIKQMEKGPSELEKLIKEMRQAEARLIRASELFSEIKVQYPKVGHRQDDPNFLHKEMLDKALNDVALLTYSFAQSSMKYGAHFTGEPDKRSIRDERRPAVLRRIFDTWHRADRNVSVTTNPVTSKRTGPLVDFTNAVVRCITDPVTEINGETIWKEVQAWHDYQKLTDVSVSIPDK